jgi:hypothetical protein
VSDDADLGPLEALVNAGRDHNGGARDPRDTSAFDYVPPLVASIARRYEHQDYLTFKELVSIGLETLVKANARYDPCCETSLSTFASPAIEFAMLRALKKARKAREREVLLSPLSGDALETHLWCGIDGQVEAKPPGRQTPVRSSGDGDHDHDGLGHVTRFELGKGARKRGVAYNENGDGSRDWERQIPDELDPGRLTKPPKKGSRCRVAGCGHTTARRKNLCALHLAEARKHRT